MWAEATFRLGAARSFAYHGTVRAAGPGPMRPGTWLAGEVRVEGAVLLPHGITREVAVDRTGRAVETVTSGPWVYSRMARAADALADARWEVIASPPAAVRGRPTGPPPAPFGVALIGDLVRSAGNRRSDPPDEAGRRRFRATVPERPTGRARPDGSLVSSLAGTEVSLFLDGSGDITDITVVAPPVDDPPLVVELAIEDLGAPGLVTPAEVAAPVRATIAADFLGPAGPRPVELGDPRAGGRRPRRRRPPAR